jgi:hypothetical protein
LQLQAPIVSKSNQIGWLIEAFMEGNKATIQTQCKQPSR